MKRIRSKQLHQYLLESGVLNGTPEAIGMAKLAYRKEYKKHWRKQHRPKKEIRFEFTIKQYATIKAKAFSCGLKPTPFCRQIILQAIQGELLIPHRDQLRHVLQLVSMAAIASERSLLHPQVTSHLAEAEQLLLDYLSA